MSFGGFEDSAQNPPTLSWISSEAPIHAMGEITDISSMV
jgi:hypothetical protein